MDTTADLSTAMLARIRNHVLVGLVGLAACITVFATGRVVGELLFGGTIPGWWRGVTLAVGIGLFPGIWLATSFRYLRCPGCNGLVGMQLSGQASLFADRYSKQCRHCGKTLFDGRFTRRMRVAQILVFFGTILFFGAMAFLRGHAGH